LIVRRLKLFDAEHAPAARSGMGSRRTSHTAEADDNHVETTHKTIRGAGPKQRCLGEA
jgi:hypothetical protein